MKEGRLMSSQTTFSVESLRQFVVQVLVKSGVPSIDSEMVAANLVQADLWGIGTHGISRFSRYLMRIKNGTINPRPNITINTSLPTLVAVDGDNGLGAVVATRALEAAMAAADRLGLCAVGIKRSNHFGAAGFYCDIAAKKGYLAIVLTNALSAMPPWGGKEVYLGTNPIAIGFPRQEKPPVVIDLATSIVARGKIIAAAKEGVIIPDGWALNKDGQPTTSAEEALLGMILPMAGPKGYALSLAVDLLSGVLTGAGFGQSVASYGSESKEADVGHFLIVIKPDGFIGKQSYYERTENFFREIKSVEKVNGVSEIYLPGEREQLLEQTLLKNGISLSVGLAKELKAISLEYGVPLTGELP